MMAVDYQPYSLVGDAGFRKVLKVAEPRYILPSRITFSRSIIPNMYESEVGKMKLLISNECNEIILNLSFTCDG